MIEGGSGRMPSPGGRARATATRLLGVRAALAHFALGLGLLVAPAGCTRATGPFRDAPVVLVSIDTLRSDRVGCYRYAKAKTPSLDALAREGVLFEDAFSHCPLTLPAHASLFTGLLPPHHAVRDNLGFTLGAQHRTLARRFQDAGYATGGAVSAYVLRRATGIADGFGTWDDSFEVVAGAEAVGDLQRDGAVATEAVARFAEAHAGRRFFAFLHLYEPHSPYAPPAAHRAHADPYDGEVAYADELVGRLLARLRAAGVYDRAIVAVTSDHGEGLMDHGEQEHGFFLYREALQVPLVLRLPGGRRVGARVAGVAGLVDLAATLLDLAGLATDGMDGLSLRGAIESGRALARPVYSETYYPRHHFGWSELLAATEERYRFIRAPRSELYDRLRDPGEQRDLAAGRAEAVAAMSAWVEQQAGGAGSAPAPATVSAEAREALRALGYVGGGAASSSAPAFGLADPKDKLAVYEMYRHAMQLRQQGCVEEALAGLRAVVADSPGLLDAWHALGTTYARLGRAREAIAAFEAMLGQDPTNAEAHIALARLHGLAGRRERAEKHALLASEKEPGRGFETLAEIRLDQKRPQDAARYARRSLEAEPDRVMSRFVLATAERRAGRCESAAVEYRHAIEAASRQKGLLVRDLHAGLADCLARLGREAEAEAEFRQEIALIPHSREARIGLGLLFRSQGRDAEARDVLAGIVTANPRAGADEYVVVARTLATIGDLEAAREWASRGRALYPKDPRLR
jgi:arylsulfatase A-like enzyme/Tfp pilus assembly protein PilF